MRLISRLVPLLVIVLMVSLWPGSSLGARFKIKATDDPDTWDPAFLRVPPRSVVIWKNPTMEIHDLTSYGGNWDKERGIPPGDSTWKRFREPGRYRYRCRVHSTMQDGLCKGMCGVIHVKK